MSAPQMTNEIKPHVTALLNKHLNCYVIAILPTPKFRNSGNFEQFSQNWG